LMALVAVMLMAARGQAQTEEPKLIHRDKQPYMGIRTSVTLQGMATVMPKLMPELYGWLDAHHVKPTGPEFIRFIVIDMDKVLDIEVGIPVAKAVAGDSRVKPGVLPEGRYASLTHFGNYSGLIAPNAQIQEWGKTKGLKWKMRKTKNGDEWVGRIEFYKTDPRKEPDPSKWETEILYMVADGKGR